MSSGKRDAPAGTPPSSPSSKRSKAAHDSPPDRDPDAEIGRIFVSVRIRPLSQREREAPGPDGVAPSRPMFAALDGTKIVETLVPQGDRARDPNAAAPAWEADAVFDGDADNATVYAKCAAPVVRAVLRGINGTVMAYGQTSSGKTHTMAGGGVDDPGVMSLAVADIFAHVRTTSAKRTFDVRASYMEIYNEEIRDLLAPAEPPGSGSAGVAPLKLILGPGGLTQVHGLEERVVTGPDAIIDLVNEGTAKRSTGKTAMNAQSSRSHAVLRIRVASAPRDDAPADVDALLRGEHAAGPLASTLYVVDLAGSERADPNARQTAKAKQTRQEGSMINQSLLTLRLCVQRLAKASQKAADERARRDAAIAAGERAPASVAPAPPPHVPYRDSKLTRILQPALAGPGRTAIVAAVTPAASHVAETYSTLNFVGVAKSVKLDAIALGANRNTNGASSKEVEAMRQSAAAEAIRREEAEKDHERVLEELSRIGARLCAAESRAAAAAAAAEFAERAAKDADKRASAFEQRAAEAEKERDQTAASAASAANAFMDAKFGSKAEAEKFARIAAEAESRAADAEARLGDAVRRAREAEQIAAHAKEAEEAAIAEAARELERANDPAHRDAKEEAERRAGDAERRLADATSELAKERERGAAMRGSLERARMRVREAEKRAEKAEEEANAKAAEESSAESEALAEAKALAARLEAALTRETETRAADVASAVADARRAKEQTAELRAALEQERAAAKELEEASALALAEVTRLGRDAEEANRRAEASERELERVDAERRVADTRGQEADDEIERLEALASRLESERATLDARVARLASERDDALGRAEESERRSAAAERASRESDRRAAASEEDARAARALAEEARRLADLAQESERLAAERATGELEAVASELERSQARAGAELAAARSAARASAAGEAAATARVDSLAMDLESAQRRAREDAEEMERRLADAAEAERDAMSEAEALRETNKELMSFMAELEHASAEASAEGEAMAAQMEQMRAELANARKAAAVAAVAAGGDETRGDSAVAAEQAAEAERAEVEKVAARATRGRAAGNAAAAKEEAATEPNPNPPAAEKKKRGRPVGSRNKKATAEGEKVKPDANVSANVNAATDKENVTVATLLAKKKPAAPAAAGERKKRRLGNTASLRDALASPTGMMR
jgi:centromeric protein E